MKNVPEEQNLQKKKLENQYAVPKEQWQVSTEMDLADISTNPACQHSQGTNTQLRSPHCK